MNKKVPFKNDFANAKKFNKYSKILLCVSAILLITSFILTKVSTPPFEIIHWIKIVNSLCIILFAICGIVVNLMHFNAESFRRDDFIDNSFGSILAENRTENYYTNDELPKGLYKMGVNNFESCFFSCKIVRESLPTLWIKAIILSILFVFFAISGFDGIAIFIIQLAIPAILLQQAIKYTLFHSRLNKVLEKYRTLFNNLKDKNDKEQCSTEIIKNILEYETTVSWGNILLNEKTYNKLNPSLSVEWEKLKKEYSIQ